MGTKYSSQSASGYNSSPPADDGSQVAANLVTWAGVKTKLADPIKTLADAENTALVTALDLSARAISGNDTAIASDHWKTLQVTGATTITLSSAASMGAGYEVGVFNAGASTVTVAPGVPADTINNVSASVTIPIKGTMIFRTNQGLTGYNIVGQSNSIQVLNQNLSVTGTITGSSSAVWGTGVANFGTIARRKTADESVTSSTALQDDDHLTFPIAANEEWIATFNLDAGASISSTTGIKVAITTPAGATLNVTANPVAFFGPTRTTTSGTALVIPTATSGNDVPIILSVWALNGATPGNITLQFAQNTSNGTAVTLRKGSYMQAVRIA